MFECDALCSKGIRFFVNIQKIKYAFVSVSVSVSACPSVHLLVGIYSAFLSVYVSVCVCPSILLLVGIYRRGVSFIIRQTLVSDWRPSLVKCIVMELSSTVITKSCLSLVKCTMMELSPVVVTNYCKVHGEGAITTH